MNQIIPSEMKAMLLKSGVSTAAKNEELDSADRHQIAVLALTQGQTPVDAIGNIVSLVHAVAAILSTTATDQSGSLYERVKRAEGHLIEELQSTIDDDSTRKLCEYTIKALAGGDNESH